MSSVKENLIAARALIDTPEKTFAHGDNLHAVQYAFDVVIPPFEEVHYAACFKALRAANNGDRVASWIRSATHPEILALFDRAIAAQENSHAG